MKTNGCNNGEKIYFLKYINMFRASLCPSSGYKYSKAALRLDIFQEIYIFTIVASVSFHLIHRLMMHGHAHLKFANAKQAKEILEFKTLKRRLQKTTPHEVLKQPYYICILTMGIMMPETC
jgi:hypothetical protein